MEANGISNRCQHCQEDKETSLVMRENFPKIIERDHYLCNKCLEYLKKKKELPDIYSPFPYVGKGRVKRKPNLDEIENKACMNWNSCESYRRIQRCKDTGK